ASSRIERVRQPAPEMVVRLITGIKTDSASVGFNQGLQPSLGHLGKRFGTTALAPKLGRIQAYQTNAAAIGQAQRIAVDDLRHLVDLQRAWRRTGGERHQR